MLLHDHIFYELIQILIKINQSCVLHLTIDISSLFYKKQIFSNEYLN